MLHTRPFQSLIAFCALVVALMSTPSQAIVSTFTGGDAGDGLDLDGLFPYAIDVRGPTVGAVRSAYFLADDSPGVSLVGANAEIINWANPSYGASTNDNKLEVVMQSIRHAGALPGTMDFNLANLVPGQSYKLQLLATESCCNRGMDVFVEGVLAADNFNPQATQGGINGSPTNGAVMTHTFVATDTVANISLVGGTGGAPDTNPILSALTLEHLNASHNGTVSVNTFNTAAGLDLSGNFVHAINVGGPAVTAGNVNFASGNPGDVILGATVTTVNHIPNWANPNYGITADDNAIETVMQSIRWTGAGDFGGNGFVGVDLQNILAGRKYKLQLLFTESCCDRVFDVLVDGELIADDFSPNLAGGVGGTGVVVTYQFTATDNLLNIILSGIDSRPGDHNPTLSGVILELEAIPEPASALLGVMGLAGLAMRRRRVA